MKRIYHADLEYKVKPTHPDIQDLPDKYWKGKTFHCEDDYHIETNCFWGDDDIRSHIWEDMALVAAGGYNIHHIYDIKLTLEEIR